MNVFDKRGHELEFVCGISALFWATCYSACGARHFELFSTPLGPCSNDESPRNSCLEGWHFLGSTHGASALQAFAGKSGLRLPSCGCASVHALPNACCDCVCGCVWLCGCVSACLSCPCVR